MIVIDSCVWIHAFLRTDKKCIYILEKIFDGDIKPIISAYLAKEICDNLPLTKENKVSYKIKHVGDFWLGENK